jgi:regulatory protein
MGVVTALHTQKRNKKRVNVFIDDEYAFSLSLDDAARLRKGQQLSDAEIAQLRHEGEIGQAVELAANFLSFRPRSAREVRDHLARKGISETSVNAALDRLGQIGYLNDQAFAEVWVRDRVASKALSPRALRYELRQKGVADEIISDLLAEQDAEATAYQAALTQARKLRRYDRQTAQQKLMGYLLRRGFSGSVARQAIHQVLTELDAAGDEVFAPDDDEAYPSAGNRKLDDDI